MVREESSTVAFWPLLRPLSLRLSSSGMHSRPSLLQREHSRTVPSGWIMSHLVRLWRQHLQRALSGMRACYRELGSCLSQGGDGRSKVETDTGGGDGDGRRANTCRSRSRKGLASRTRPSCDPAHCGAFSLYLEHLSTG